MEELLQSNKTMSLQQTNQELYKVVSQLAESNRNFKQWLYTLERVI
ncbi:6806_t:CDS:1, partial [Gigaspora rosea]